MEDRKRTLFAVIIACVVVAAVLYSFGLNLFSNYPQLILADPEATASHGVGDQEPDNQGGIPVELTRETVQRVVADLSRYTSYSRTVTVTYYWGDGESGTAEAAVWANDGWVRTDVTLASGMTEHSIVGNDQFWLWYDDEQVVHCGPAGEMTADLMQHIPTYEDVLALSQDDIIWASYMNREGEACIYVETRRASSEYTDCYWISLSNGLLMAAESTLEGRLVYTMSSRDLVSPLRNAESYFKLPDGTNPLNPPQDQGGA